MSDYFQHHADIKRLHEMARRGHKVVEDRDERGVLFRVRLVPA